MNLGLFGCPFPDEPRMSKTTIQKDQYDFSSDEEVTVQYDRTILFPITRWLQINRGEQITHEKLDEFRSLATQVQSDFIVESDSEQAIAIWDSIVDPVNSAIFHLWDVRGELRPWIVEESCKILVGTGSGYELPEINSSVYRREKEFRGGASSMEMALANLGDAAMGISSENKTFSEDEIDEAQESNQGMVDYDHDLSKYL